MASRLEALETEVAALVAWRDATPAPTPPTPAPHKCPTTFAFTHFRAEWVANTVEHSPRTGTVSFGQGDGTWRPETSTTWSDAGNNNAWAQLTMQGRHYTADGGQNCENKGPILGGGETIAWSTGDAPGADFDGTVRLWCTVVGDPRSARWHFTGSADGATFHDLGSIDYYAADGCGWKEFALPLGCH